MPVNHKMYLLTMAVLAICAFGAATLGFIRHRYFR